MRLKTISFLIILFSLAIISCSENNPSAKKAKPDSCSDSLNKISVAKSDSEKVVDNILKSIRDTLPEFQNVSPQVLREDTVFSLFLSDGLNSITVLYDAKGNVLCTFRNYIQPNICHEKNYYANGKLKREGMGLTGWEGNGLGIFDPGLDILIGKWNYYSITGKLDSIVDHDKDYKISYSDALLRAEKHGWKKSDVTMYWDWDSSNNLKSWRVTYIGKNNPSKFINLIINAKTGKEKMDNSYYIIVTDTNGCKRNFGKAIN